MNRCKLIFECHNGLKDCPFMTKELTASGQCGYTVSRFGVYYCYNEEAMMDALVKQLDSGNQEGRKWAMK